MFGSDVAEVSEGKLTPLRLLEVRIHFVVFQTTMGQTGRGQRDAAIRQVPGGNIWVDLGGTTASEWQDESHTTP